MTPPAPTASRPSAGWATSTTASEGAYLRKRRFWAAAGMMSSSMRDQFGPVAEAAARSGPSSRRRLRSSISAIHVVTRPCTSPTGGAGTGGGGPGGRGGGGGGGGEGGGGDRGGGGGGTRGGGPGGGGGGGRPRHARG